MTKNQDSISEIRVEEVHDHEDGKHFYRVYFHYKNGKIKNNFFLKKRKHMIILK